MLKRTVTFIALSIVLPTATFAQGLPSLNEIIHFASREEGRALLTMQDQYTAKWSAFDIQSRAQDVHATKEAVLDMMNDQVLTWTTEEQERIRTVLAAIDSQVVHNDYRLPLPSTVSLVKSTLLEEGGADGYTRENYIVLRQDLIFRDDDMLKHILLHELFHIMTRHDAAFREAAYNVIGFKVDNPVEYPHSIADLRITNPDAHANDSYISLLTRDSIPVDCMMMLYADKPWEGGSFFSYIQLAFVELVGAPGKKVIKIINGAPVMYKTGEVTGFLEQVGSNTQYIIDPEEICADNFSYVFEDFDHKPSPPIIEGIRDILLKD